MRNALAPGSSITQSQRSWPNWSWNVTMPASPSPSSAVLSVGAARFFVGLEVVDLGWGQLCVVCPCWPHRKHVVAKVVYARPRGSASLGFLGGYRTTFLPLPLFLPFEPLGPLPFPRPGDEVEEVGDSPGVRFAWASAKATTGTKPLASLRSLNLFRASR